MVDDGTIEASATVGGRCTCTTAADSQQLIVSPIPRHHFVGQGDGDLLRLRQAVRTNFFGRFFAAGNGSLYRSERLVADDALAAEIDVKLL